MNFKYGLWLICICILGGLPVLNAQVEYADSLAYTLSIDLAGTRSTGIFSRTTLQAGAKLKVTKNRWEFSEDLSYQFNNTNGFQFLDDWRNLAFVQYHLGGKWNWFPIGIHLFETNLIYRVKNRHRLGAGIGAYPINKNGYQVRFTTGYFYENELYNGDTFISSELIDPRRRNSSGWLHLTNKIPIAEKGVFMLDFWYFQSFKERADYAISILPKVQISLNKHISFMVRYDWRFENVYLESLVDTNDLLLVGINVKLGN